MGIEDDEPYGARMEPPPYGRPPGPPGGGYYPPPGGPEGYTDPPPSWNPPQQDVNSEERVLGGGRTLRVYPGWIRWLCMITCICAGTFCSIVFKWQNKAVVRNCPDCEETQFSGAVFQTQMMFIGEALSILVYMADCYFSDRSNKALVFDFARSQKYYDQPKLPQWYFMLFAQLDFAGNMAIMIALKLTYASTVQMLRNLMIVVTCCLQPIMLRRAVRVHEIVGVLIVTCSMALSAIPAVMNPDTSANSSTKDTIMGVVLALVGTALQAVQALSEELCMRKGRSSAMRSIGWEGIGGLITSFIAWPICHKAGLEDVNGSWYAAPRSVLVTVTTVVYLPCCCAFNVSGYATTILGSALLKSVCYAVRSPLVWVISLIVKWQNYEHWSLGSAILFFIGFAVYVNITGFPHGHSVDRWFCTPIHCCCTDPKWDVPYDPVDASEEEERKLGGRDEV